MDKKEPKKCGDCRNTIKVEFGRLECLILEHSHPNKDATVKANQKACKHAK